ncbi:UDP-Glycosyltransferase/glycogen phosphorylase, partial [Aureobasidium melanogenum]
MAGINGFQNDIHVVFISCPFYGHVRPLRSLASGLSDLGYRNMTFITGTTFRQGIEAINNVNFVPLKGLAEYDPDNLSATFPERALQPLDETLALWDIEHIFFGALHDQFEVLKDVISSPELRDKRVVVVADWLVTGTLPISLKSPHVRQVPIIAIGHSVFFGLSKDCAPFGMGLPPQSKERNLELNAKTKRMFGKVYAGAKKTMARYGCPSGLKHEFVVEDMIYSADRFFQLCVPQLEYPRSDLPPNVEFTGALLGKNDNKSEPDWFNSFVRGYDERPLVVVTSGTAASADVEQLIMPTIEACRSLPVRVVVCAVNVHPPKDYPMPENVKIARWIPFEELFKHASLVVSNGGFGGITQAFAAGVPMVLAGVTEDKMETTARAAMTGAAINLRTQTPSVEQVKQAIETTTSGNSYQEKALVLKQAYASYDTLGIIENAVRVTAKA